MDSIVRGHGPELCLILEPSRLLEYPSPRRSSNRDATDVRATAALLNYFAYLSHLNHIDLSHTLTHDTTMG